MLQWTTRCVSLSILVSSRYMPSSGIVGSLGGFIPSILRHLRTIFCSGCINLHSHQQCKSVPFSPHPFQHLLFVDLLMKTILTGCFWTVVLEKSLKYLLDYKEIQPINPKGNQSWIFIGRTDAETEIPILWPPDAKNWLIGKDPDGGKDLRHEEKGTTENEMVGCHHRLNGHEFK